MSLRSTLIDRGWYQPLDCPLAPAARRVKDAAGTAKPLVLDAVGWLCYVSLLLVTLPGGLFVVPFIVLRSSANFLNLGLDFLFADSI
jgi:hypothetical protein